MLLKPSELLRKAKERIEQGREKYTCIAMEQVAADAEGVDYGDAAWHEEELLRAKEFLYQHRTDRFTSRDGVFFHEHEDRIEGITKAIADAEAAGE